MCKSHLEAHLSNPSIKINRCANCEKVSISGYCYITKLLSILINLEIKLYLKQAPSYYRYILEFTGKMIRCLRFVFKFFRDLS